MHVLWKVISKMDVKLVSLKSQHFSKIITIENVASSNTAMYISSKFLSLCRKQQDADWNGITNFMTEIY